MHTPSVPPKRDPLGEASAVKVETRGKGAFDLDGASEPYSRGARQACLGDSTRLARGGTEEFRDCRCAGILVNLIGVRNIKNDDQLNFLQNNSRSFACCP